MAILDIDIGNTRLKWRCADLQGAVLRLGRSDQSVVSELIERVEAVQIERVRVASVASPELSQILAARIESELGVVPGFAVVTPEVDGLSCGYDDVARLGVDRWLAVLAAKGMGLDDAVVVDCGSAVTVDLLESGQHAGGYIVPGLRLMVESLFRDTTRVKVKGAEVDSSLPGKNTDEAVNRGVLLMVVGLVENICRRFVAGRGQAPVVLLTGGDAALVREELQWVEGCIDKVLINPDLVLDGLQWSSFVSETN